MTNQAEGIRDCQEQLAQVQARIAEVVASRAEALSPMTQAIVNRRLHNLYALESDIKRDLASCEEAA